MGAEPLHTETGVTFRPKVIEGRRDLALDPAVASRAADAKRKIVTDALSHRSVPDEQVWQYVEEYLTETMARNFSRGVVSPMATEVPLGNLVYDYIFGHEASDDAAALEGRRAVHLDMIDINLQGIPTDAKIRVLKEHFPRLRPIHAQLDKALADNHDPASRKIQRSAYAITQILMVGSPTEPKGYRKLLGVNDAKILWTPSISAAQRR